MLKRTLLVGWALLILGGTLILQFPNARWIHVVSEIVWVLSIGIFIATVVFVAVTAARLITKILGPSKKSPTALARNAQPAPKSRRNRRLWLGLGTVIAMAAFVAALLAFIENEFRSSEVYQMSLVRAQQSAEVTRIVGVPGRPGWFVTGEISESTDGDGRATLGIPLNGPRGSGTLRVRARRKGGNWRLYVLQFAPKDRSSTIDLMGQTSAEHPALP
jgi:hypothetical protein